VKTRRIAVAYDAGLCGAPEGAAVHDDIRGTVAAAQEALATRGFDAVRMPVRTTDDVLPALAALRPHAVFNLVEGLDGRAGAEAQVARLFERAGVPFTGCPAACLDACLDKQVARERLAARGLPVPRGRVFPAPGPAGELRFPLIVKCLREDASLGLDDGAVVRSEGELRGRIAWAVEEFGQPALVEEFLEGREFNVAVAGPEAEALPVAEIDFSATPESRPRFVSYAAKWRPGSVEDRSTAPRCPAAIPARLASRLRRLALRAFHIMGCRDFARVDLRADAAGRPHILEVNPNPDLSPDAGFARAARAHGWSYEDLVERLVLWALGRPSHAVHARASRPAPV
jgi:D-alanine-D-alanine ligase